jgi:hypothetical protein
VTWDQILGVPVALPSLQHQQSLEDLAGFEDFVIAMQQLSQTIEDANAPYIGDRTFVNPDVIVDPNNIEGLAGRGHYRISSPGFELFVANVVTQVNNSTLTATIGTGEGILSVIQEGTFILQVYTPASLDTGVAFIRRRVGGVWGNWTARPTLAYIDSMISGTAVSPKVISTSALLGSLVTPGLYRTSSVEATLVAREAPVNLHGIVTVLINDGTPDLIRQEYRPIANNDVWSRTRNALGAWSAWQHIAPATGVGQEWVDVISSRDWNVWYPNSGSRPKMMTVTVRDHDNLDDVFLQVQGAAVGAAVLTVASFVFRAGIGSSDLATDTVTFLVPPGSQVMLYKEGGSNAVITHWLELA